MLFDTSNSFDISIPSNPGEVPLRASVAYDSLLIILIIIGATGIILCAIGYLYKSLQSKGIIRKKFSFLANLADKLAYEIQRPMAEIEAFIKLLSEKFYDEDFRNDFFLYYWNLLDNSSSKRQHFCFDGRS